MAYTYVIDIATQDGIAPDRTIRPDLYITDELGAGVDIAIPGNFREGVQVRAEWHGAIFVFIGRFEQQF